MRNELDDKWRFFVFTDARELRRTGSTGAHTTAGDDLTTEETTGRRTGGK